MKYAHVRLEILQVFIHSDMLVWTCACVDLRLSTHVIENVNILRSLIFSFNNQNESG